MTSFTLHFILCNLFISLSILMVLGIKYLFKNYLSAQTAYRLWVLLFMLMALPFLPIRLSEITSIFFRGTESGTTLPTVPAAPAVIQTLRHTSPEWMNDFTVFREFCSRQIYRDGLFYFMADRHFLYADLPTAGQKKTALFKENCCSGSGNKHKKTFQ